MRVAVTNPKLINCRQHSTFDALYVMSVAAVTKVVGYVWHSTISTQDDRCDLPEFCDFDRISLNTCQRINNAIQQQAWHRS
jgi:hypothetical protein